ncbi:MAG: arginyl-tRNA synthetase [Chloroflexi bacterium]|nr:MAG: arginyl-tRNA synthetase [Chloroflexota bacterium]
MTQLVRDAVRAAIAAALDDAQQHGALPRLPGAEIAVERPQKPEHGDYASSVALRLAGTVKRKPLDVAQAIADSIQTGPLIDAVEVAPPGFINLRLSPHWKREQVNDILADPHAWGSIDIGHGQKLQVEFVSANPTGPLQVGNGRGAVLGDALASVLAAAGYNVEREYYVNDAGTQVRVFAETLHVRYQQHFGRDVEVPAEGYQGRYIVDLAEAIAADVGQQYLQPEGAPPPPSDQPDPLATEGLRRMLDQIRADLGLLGINFDQWFSEASLLSPRDALDGRSVYDTAMARLREGGHVVEKEGAVWFASSSDDDKDNVIVRSSGEPTYFATDIAYHFDKFALRRFDRVINVWGADHQGHVARTKAATAAVAGAANAQAEHGLEMLLYQLVHLRRGGERVRMSKRTGELVTLRELVQEVGPDVTRYFMLERSADAQMDFDLELATSQDPKQNPVSYVQYAHARCASILRTAAAEGLDAPTPESTADVQLLVEPTEIALIDAMLRLPELVELMATKLEPHHLTTYALELAQQFTQFYGACRVVDPSAPDRSRARLKLTRAAQIVLARALGLMGVAAPDEM